MDCGINFAIIQLSTILTPLMLMQLEPLADGTGREQGREIQLYDRSPLRMGGMPPPVVDC